MKGRKINRREVREKKRGGEGEREGERENEKILI